MSELPLIFDSVAQLLLVYLVLVVAETVYVTFGFGSGLIAVGGLAMVVPEVLDVVVVLLLISLPCELFVVIRSRQQIIWKGMALIAIGVAVGIFAGTRILRVAEPTFVLILLGVFLIVAGTAFLLIPVRRTFSIPVWVGPHVGLVSGVLTGMFGTGGPPLIFYYQLGGVAKAVFRGNLMLIFLLMTLIRIPSYAFAGFITIERLWSALVVMPAVILGIWLGNRVHLQLDEVTFRRMVSVALVIIGAVLLVQRLLA
jgi:uncharacterized membrane protein YfcA